MTPGTTKGRRLSTAERRAIRANLVRLARQTGARTYQFAWDRDQKVQITAFPSGRSTVKDVDDAGLSLEPERLLTALGVPARWMGVALAAFALAGELARLLL
jgi:hypothetical protein